MSLRNPLAQLNLLLHLSMDYPPDGSINPFLKRAGYRVYSIDRPFSVPFDILRDLGANFSPKPSSSCRPDLVLLNSQRACALLIECKSSSFGPDTDQGSQASTLLLIGLENFRSQIGTPWLEHLLDVFLVPAEQVELQERCLNEISSRLANRGQAVSPAQAWGLLLGSGGVYLTNLSASPCLDECNRVLVVETEEPENYEPVRIIPIDPSIDSRDPEGHRIVCERARNIFVKTALTQMNSSSPPCTILISVREICSQIVLVWDVWNKDSQKWLRTLVRRVLRPRIDDMISAGAEEVQCREYDFCLRVPSDEVRSDIKKVLLSVRSRKAEVSPRGQEALPLEEPPDANA